MAPLSSYLRALLLALLCLLAAAPANAYNTAVKCHANGSLNENLDRVLQDPGRWSCLQGGYNPAAERTWLSFAIDRASASGPEKLVVRNGRFDQIAITLIGANGEHIDRIFRHDQLTPNSAGPFLSLALPAAPFQPQRIVVAVDQPWSGLTLSETRLLPQGSDGRWSLQILLLTAAAIGLLAAPILLNLAYFAVLRQNFVLWHLVIAMGMLVYALCDSGLIFEFTSVKGDTVATLTMLSQTFAVAASGMFTITVLEPWTAGRSARKMLLVATLGTFLVTGLLALPIDALRETSIYLREASFLPLVVLTSWVVYRAIARGSVAARFQLAAWLPIVIVAIEKAVRNSGLYTAPAIVDHVLFPVLALEVIITSMLVTHRFMAIRRQLDFAVDRADQLRLEAFRDPLTGLHNRKALDSLFASFHAKGFHTVALLDLDSFKIINDTFGHAVGDEVLRATAAALAPDEDTEAVRMGGEEFLLLLRGEAAIERAEQRRNAITLRVASDVPGLDRMVTASMGVVSQAGARMATTDFATLFAHCDRLLYEAKRNGRNRTASERLQTFGERRNGRRASDDKRAAA